MARYLRPVGTGFARSAPLRLVFGAVMSAAPGAVFRALADDTPGWTAWFGAVTYARPLAQGAAREIRLRGGARFKELTLTRQTPEVYAYRVEETNVPGFDALLEEWHLAPEADGTRIRWTIAADGTAVLGALLRLGRPGLAREFRRAVAALDRRLTPAGPA